MYKIEMDQCPSTLRELIPETAMTRTGYPLKSRSNSTLIKVRTQIHVMQDSVFPATIRA